MKVLSLENFKAFFAMMTTKFATKDYVNAACQNKPVIITVDEWESWQSDLGFDELIRIAHEDPRRLVIKEVSSNGDAELCALCPVLCTDDSPGCEDMLFVCYSGYDDYSTMLTLKKDGSIETGFPF